VKRFSWFALVSYCTAATLVSAFALAVVFAGATLAVPLAAAMGGRNGSTGTANPTAPQKFVGVVTDDHCGARHTSAEGMSSAECVQHCIRGGAHYALVNAERTYLLTGNISQIEKSAGQRVNVTGTLQGNSVNVISVTAQ
jgi:hypothetical protein